MRETYWGYWLVLLGVFVIGVMLLVNNISTTNTQDYYNIKEVTQASMIDAVDFSYYRLYGNIKMSEQKFVENFVRRFTENLNMANTYDVEFYDLYEVPPKVSVKISTGSRSFNIANSRNDYDVVTTLNAVLELGVEGEGGPNAKKSKSTSCKMYIYNKLMDYFQGKTVDGSSIASDRSRYGDLNLSQKQLQTLSKIKTLDEFKIWFNNKNNDDDKFRINGESAKSFLTDKVSDNKYSSLPQYIKDWHQRGWIDLKH